MIHCIFMEMKADENGLIEEAFAKLPGDAQILYFVMLNI